MQDPVPIGLSCEDVRSTTNVSTRWRIRNSAGQIANIQMRIAPSVSRVFATRTKLSVNQTYMEEISGEINSHLK